MQNEHLEVNGLLSNFIVGVIYLSLKCLCNYFYSMNKVVVRAEYLLYLGYCGWSYHTGEPGPLCVLSCA